MIAYLPIPDTKFKHSNKEVDKVFNAVVIEKELKRLLKGSGKSCKSPTKGRRQSMGDDNDDESD